MTQPAKIGRRRTFMRSPLWRGIAAVSLSAATVSAAEAQSVETPALEIGIDYQTFQRDTVNRFHGWVVSAARPVNDYLAIVGEVGDARGGDDQYYPYVEEDEWYTFAGGVRFLWRRPRVTTFVDGLVGAAIINQQFHHRHRVSTFNETLGLIQ